jgi:hypothetical protein
MLPRSSLISWRNGRAGAGPQDLAQAMELAVTNAAAIESCGQQEHGSTLPLEGTSNILRAAARASSCWTPHAEELIELAVEGVSRMQRLIRIDS